jgi:hypothetical protein
VHYLDLYHQSPGGTATPPTPASACALVGRRLVMTETSPRLICVFSATPWSGLDYPRVTCLRRILMRTIRNYGRRTPDLPDGCPETFDPGVLRFAWRFPAESRPQILPALDRFGGHLNIFRLGNDRDVAAFSRARGIAR